MATKDERFIVYAYQEALARGEEVAVLNRYAIGKKAGLTERGVNASFKLFVRSNFVKSLGEEEFSLTENGRFLAKRLLEQKDFL